MFFDTSFSGRIIQVTEALSFDDAVSNQVLAIDQLLQHSGLRSEIYTKWHDPRHELARQSIDELRVDERDVVVYHFYGYAGHTLPIVAELYCTRVMVYHNITPHEFFATSSGLHDFCKRGREQLAAFLPRFHRVWGDSQYNLDELLASGVPPEHASVLPILVQPPAQPSPPGRRPGVWLFVGRIAANKGQAALVRIFAQVHQSHPTLAQELHLVGGYEAEDPYYSALLAAVDRSGCASRIRILGKVSSPERDRLYGEASIFVSCSQHEGFGVPLVEASFHGLPAVALAHAAVPETLGTPEGLADTADELQELAVRVLGDPEFRGTLLQAQTRNATRFCAAGVRAALHEALRTVLPQRETFSRLSVVICTYNRRDYLERVLNYLEYQHSRAFEVVVVDGPSNDGTKELLAGYKGRVKIANNEFRNLSVSRNIGIELASGDVVAFIDDDALPFDDWAANVLAEYNARPLTTAALGGPVYYAGSLDFQAQDIVINRFGDTQVNVPREQVGRDGWYRLNIGTNATFTRTALHQVRGFDEQFDYFLDESELCFRLQMRGHLVGYAERVLLRHEFARSANRTGKFSYNWHSICKNTAYFMAAYSGLSGGELRARLQAYTERDRTAPMAAALARGEIDQAEHDKHAQAIWSGVEAGLADFAKHFPRTRALREVGGSFLPFDTSPGAATAEGSGALHICIITKEFPPFVPGGGIGTLYYHLASELLLMGHQVTVISPGDGEPYRRGRFRLMYTPVSHLQAASLDAGLAHNMSWSVSAMAAVARVHQETPVDVVDSALWDSEALALSMLPPAQRPPIVVRLVTPFAVAARINNWSVPAEISAVFNEAEAQLIRGADAVVPISRAIAKSITDIHQVVDDSRWRQIPCGIAHWPFFDVNLGYGEISAQDRIPSDVLGAGRMVLFVGRLETRKGIDLLLEAANLFLQDDKDAYLLVCGRDIEGWVARSSAVLRQDLAGRVHFIGEVADSTKEKLLARAACLVFPSRYESFGLVPLEAFIHGVPVVACRAGAIPEVVLDGESGLLFEPEDFQELARHVSSLLLDATLHSTLSRGARMRARELGSRQSAVHSVRLYRDLLAQRESKRLPTAH